MSKFYKFGLVGTQFRPRGLDIVNQMDSLHPALLVREPENKFDPNAVAVYVQIGYIPKAQAAAWASQLDTLEPRVTHYCEVRGGRSVELTIDDAPMQGEAEEPPPTEKDAP